MGCHPKVENVLVHWYYILFTKMSTPCVKTADEDESAVVDKVTLCNKDIHSQVTRIEAQSVILIFAHKVQNTVRSKMRLPP